MQISLANLFIILEDPIQSALLKFTKKYSPNEKSLKTYCSYLSDAIKVVNVNVNKNSKQTTKQFFAY